MNQPDFIAAKLFAVDRLHHSLSPVITYHSRTHTLDEVVPAVDRMILEERVQDADEQLRLRTAALFHDLGYADVHINHELVSARIAGEALPGFGYSPRHVEDIQAMIMATRLPQTPHGKLEEILADADLDVLGRQNFFDRNLDLRKEMEFLQQPVSDEVWYRSQIKFLQDHHYFTHSAHELRNPGKQKNLLQLGYLLALAQKADP